MITNFFKITLVGASVIGFLSCENGSTSNKKSKKGVVYECPMACQVDTVYLNLMECPICGMDLAPKSIDTFFLEQKKLIKN